MTWEGFEICGVTWPDKHQAQIHIARDGFSRECYLKVLISEDNILLCELFGEAIDISKAFCLNSATATEEDVQS